MIVRRNPEKVNADAAKKAKDGKTGRTRLTINMETLESFIRLQCTQSEVCQALGVSESTVQRFVKRNYTDENGAQYTFERLYKELTALSNVSLRRAQWKNAISKGSVAMQIWLGKQHLDQADKVQSSNDNTEKVIIEYDVREALYKEEIEKEKG